MFHTFCIIGGDLRQLALARYLSNKGYCVKIFGFEKDIDTSDFEKAKTLSEAAKSEIIVLPLPVSHDNIILNAPFYDGEIKLSEMVDYFQKGTLIFGGKISSVIRNLFCEFAAYDYFEREELSVLNAIPTAEGAIEIALCETPHTLHKSNCLVIGYGRIGKLLAERLRAFGAHVTVSARKQSDFAWIEACGFEVANSNNLGDKISDFDVIFNTVPSVILNDEQLMKIPKDTLIIDLASKPGGVDFDMAKKLGTRVIWALSLPGKTAPITSGEIIGKTIINILKEVEEL